jgi:hypothetical protein
MSPRATVAAAIVVEINPIVTAVIRRRPRSPRGYMSVSLTLKREYMSNIVSFSCCRLGDRPSEVTNENLYAADCCSLVVHWLQTL